MTEGYVSEIDKSLTFKLTGKIGGLLGMGLGYLSGLVGGTVKDIVLDKLPYLMSGQDVNNNLLKSFTYGTGLAAQFAIIGATVGYGLTKLYLGKWKDLKNLEEVE